MCEERSEPCDLEKKQTRRYAMCGAVLVSFEPYEIPEREVCYFHDLLKSLPRTPILPETLRHASDVSRVWAAGLTLALRFGRS
jgi:hypothetical protein